MQTLIKIPINNAEGIHHRFEWNSEKYKKLVGVFCSPGIELALVFNDGKQVFVRQFEFSHTKNISPNSRVLFVEKALNNEIITGVVSKLNPKDSNKSVYLIVEK